MLGRRRTTPGSLLSNALVILAIALTPNAQASENHSLFHYIQAIKKFPVGSESEELMDTLGLVSKYPFTEAMDALIERLDLEVDGIVARFKKLNNREIRDVNGDLKPAVMLYILNKLSQHMTVGYLRKVEVILEKLSDAFEASAALNQRTSEAYFQLVAKSKNRTKPLESIVPTLQDVPAGAAILPTPSEAHLIADSRSVGMRIRDARETVTKYLQKYVVGEDEAIQAFADLEERNVVFVEREVPPRILLAGLPGVGKDTLVEAYTDYLNGGIRGSWKSGHLLKAPVMKDESDLWKFLGAKSGYVDSDSVPALITFLVNHSNGRYRIERREQADGRTKWRVLENRSQVVNAEMSSPKQGVLLLNEFHNWTQEMKDTLKVAMEKGEWEINNPGGGLSKIYVPVTFVFATNEGSALITSMEADGQRHGKPLSYDKMLEKWEAVRRDRQAILRELQRSNEQRSVNGASLGYSREWLNRLEGWPVVLMKPHGPEDLQAIARIKLGDLADQYRHNSIIANLELEWTDELIRFVQEYKYSPEDMARPIAGKVDQLVMKTINQAIRNDQIPLQGNLKVRLTPVRNPDRTSSMEFVVTRKDNGEVIKRFSEVIEATLGDRERPTISTDRVDHLLTFGDFLKRNVFGLHPHLVKSLTTGILLADETRYGRENDKGPRQGATIIGLFGLSSTGKTETAKVINQFLAADRKPFVIDFSQIVSVQDLEEKILGSRDMRNKPIKSDFMKEYDRNHGDLLVVLDEIANAKPGLVKALYDFLREEEITTFSDGESRSMKRVKIVMTGNVGEEWYSGISRNLPWWIQMYAMREVYNQAITNGGARRAAMEKFFSEAFINRIGDENIYFFGPHTFKSLRQLTFLKLMQMVENLKVYEGRMGWDIRFKDVEAFLDIAEMVEEHGFVVREQGASIDRFVHKTLERGLRVLLLQQKVPRGQTVILSRLKKADKTITVGGQTVTQLSLRLETADSHPLTLNLHGKHVESEPTIRDEDRYLTAIHEAGHAVARAVLLKGVNQPTRISIIPGVALIGSDWVHYAGIAQASELRETRMTLERVIAEMAVLAAGETAQRFATKGHRHDAGKHNDIQKATEIAMRAILQWGLSERWGTTSIPQNMSMADYAASLSESRRNLLNEEVERLMKMARDLANIVIAGNMDRGVIPVALALAEKGRLEGQVLRELMGRLDLVYPDANGRVRITPEVASKWLKGQPGSRSVDAELVDYLPLPKRIVRHEDIIARDRDQERAQAELPKDLPLADSGDASCSNWLNGSGDAVAR